MTASHLPYTRNGLKFFTKRGGLSSVEVEGICDRAARKYVARKMGLGGGGLGMPPVVMRVDLMSAYAQHLRDIIKERVAHPTHYDTPLEGFKVIVNAGNGCGGFFAWDVLEKLGADTTGSLHLEPDGMFPNHMPNPEDALELCCRCHSARRGSGHNPLGHGCRLKRLRELTQLREGAPGAGKWC